MLLFHNLPPGLRPDSPAMASCSRPQAGPQPPRMEPAAAGKATPTPLELLKATVTFAKTKTCLRKLTATPCSRGPAQSCGDVRVCVGDVAESSATRAEPSKSPDKQAEFG